MHAALSSEPELASLDKLDRLAAFEAHIQALEEEEAQASNMRVGGAHTQSLRRIAPRADAPCNIVLLPGLTSSAFLLTRPNPTSFLFPYPPFLVPARLPHAARAPRHRFERICPTLTPPGPLQAREAARASQRRSDRKKRDAFRATIAAAWAGEEIPPGGAALSLTPASVWKEVATVLEGTEDYTGCLDQPGMRARPLLNLHLARFHLHSHKHTQRMHAADPPSHARTQGRFRSGMTPPASHTPTPTSRHPPSDISPSPAHPHHFSRLVSPGSI